MKQDYGHITLDAQTKEKCDSDYIPVGDSGKKLSKLGYRTVYNTAASWNGRATGKMNAYCKAGSKIREKKTVSGDGRFRESWQEIAYRRIKAYNYDVNEHWGEKMGWEIQGK